MKYFVSSDIHGFYKEWQKALRNKGYDKNNPNHCIVLCGDVLDRGRQPKQIINYILRNKEKIILVRGNHEDLMQEMINRNEAYWHDLSNGTARTIVDLCPEWEVTRFDLKEIAKETRLQEVLDSFVDYFETDHYVFVHGWIPTKGSEQKYDKNWRNAGKERWEAARWANPVEMYKNRIFAPNKTIVCGHWHCSSFWHEEDPIRYKEYGEGANYKPYIKTEVMAIDACTALSGKVNCVVIEDTKCKDNNKQ